MEQAGQERLWTPANVVTLVRICFVPVFVFLFLAPWPDWVPFDDVKAWKPWVAAGAFVLIAATDALDGYLARSRGEVTNFGKFMDPLADKILVLAALLSLTELGVLPAWVTLIIMSREFIVSGIRMIAASQGSVIAASWYGKAKTVTQMIAIVLFIIKDELVIKGLDLPLGTPLSIAAWVVMLAALALTIISMLDYLVKAKALLGFSTSRTSTHMASVSDSLKQGDSSADSYEELAIDPAALSDEALMSLASRVIDAAMHRQTQIACAESLTGGMIASLLTSVSGSSAVVRGGIVSYVNEIKHELLGVSDKTLAHYGAVSEQCARAMAEGARTRLACDLSVAVTGIAGPTGAEPGKPVGTLWLATSNEGKVFAQRFQLSGDRDQVRRASARCALQALLAELER